MGPEFRREFWVINKNGESLAWRWVLTPLEGWGMGISQCSMASTDETSPNL